MKKSRLFCSQTFFRKRIVALCCAAIGIMIAASSSAEEWMVNFQKGSCVQSEVGLADYIKSLKELNRPHEIIVNREKNYTVVHLKNDRNQGKGQFMYFSPDRKACTAMIPEAFAKNGKRY